jgi:type IV secretory pathway TraG/TraD family ATPase VirD4
MSSQDQERSLINADEVMKLPLDQFILICQGLPPYIGKKNVYYEDPAFKARLCPPAFTTREQAVKIAAPTVAKLSGRRWFDLAEPERTPDMDDGEAAAMWEKFEGPYDNQDEIENRPPEEDAPDPPPDTANFLK